MTAIRNWTKSSLALRGLQLLALSEVSPRIWQESLPGRVQSALNTWSRSSRLSRWVEPASLVVLCALVLFSAYLPTALSGLLLTAASVCTVFLFAVRSRPLVPLTLPVLAFWVAALVACAASPRLALSIDGFVKFSLYLGGFALAVQLLERPLYRTVTVAAYLIATLPMSLYGLWQWRTGAAALATWVDPDSPLADTTRVYSFLGNPNLLAGYLLAAIPLGLVGAFIWKSWGAKFVALSAASGATLCLIFTYSRGGWVALAAMLAFLAALFYSRFSLRLKPQWRLWLPVGLIVGISVVLALAAGGVPAVSERH